MGISRRPPRARGVIDIVDRFRPRTDPAFVRAAVASALRHAALPHLEVAVLLTGDDEIAELHGRFLDDPTETDVMSFLVDGTANVVVNVARARREAARLGTTIRAELALYVVHGVLHCCGFDDRDADERREMRDAECTVLRSIGVEHSPVDA
ncbi:MAG: rRNA maturation RNase YbeY [Planctomycetes bacterium]|nr:rRNA maturation RNase YbeY [Planctomycetota bacterium]